MLADEALTRGLRGSHVSVQPESATAINKTPQNRPGHFRAAVIKRQHTTGTTRNLAGPLNTCALVGTNTTGELITTGVVRHPLRIRVQFPAFNNRD